MGTSLTTHTTAGSGTHSASDAAYTGSARATIATTILRVICGFLFLAHGWQKYFEYTIAGTQSTFASMGIPASDIVAPLVATLELAGGVALILGVLTRPVAALLALNMFGALVTQHLPGGVFVDNGGFELVLAFGGGAAAIAVLGGGAWSVDRMLFARSTGRAARFLYSGSRA
ncbi:DoxX family protein [Klugiella xanthotipulae]|uniref:Putative oxidoreductase n=1 Tax=Klugiella xanthotipulae TaxID=244735 RepID=A0A543I5Z1_9MICO|nr:DoxX family protein [Klugiella xanthotipulae]TQM66022.1 putative oxidoreductase [Klugiella xanthotipulae]